MKKHNRCACLLLAACLWSSTSYAETYPVDPEFEELLALDLDQLSVTSVSKRMQKLIDAPAAIYVITNEDLRRSGVTTIPEALRMAPGVHVAQIASNRWAISARGFNNAISNKLLVMIDGRSIYTPVFSGTYWDDQGTPIEDVERIEIIRGPGASLWGANAVNGIINIITKHAKNTQGNYVTAGVGTSENSLEGRHGGAWGKNGYYRLYGQYATYGRTENPGGGENSDDWYRARTGFRVDKQQSRKNSLTVQGDIYQGVQGSNTRLPTLSAPFLQTFVNDDDSFGGNALVRWERDVAPGSRTNLQAYVDHYYRSELAAKQQISTLDVQFQHTLTPNSRHHFIWGMGGRAYHEELDSSFNASFNDESPNHGVVNAFVQEEYAIIPRTLFATVGSKFEYNDFTGFEVQPNARLSWNVASNQMFWGAVSRAVRVPSSIERDVRLAVQIDPVVPALPLIYTISGNPDQESEELTAFEIGHRIQPTHDLSFDTALFFHDYENLQTISISGTPFPGNGGMIVPFPVSNLGSGHVYGLEESINWNIRKNWRLAGSYSYLLMNLEVEPGTVTTLEAGEELAPRHQFSIQSYYNVTDRLEWDNMLYYTSSITSPASSYLRHDMRIGYKIMTGLDVSLIGRNLLDPSHSEFPNATQAEAERGVLGRITWKF